MRRGGARCAEPCACACPRPARTPLLPSRPPRAHARPRSPCQRVGRPQVRHVQAPARRYPGRCGRPFFFRRVGGSSQLPATRARTKPGGGAASSAAQTVESAVDAALASVLQLEAEGVVPDGILAVLQPSSSSSGPLRPSRGSRVADANERLRLHEMASQLSPSRCRVVVRDGS